MKKFLYIIGSVIVIIIVWVIIANVSPVSYEDYIQNDFSDEKILFESDEIRFDNDTGKIITSIGSEENSDYYSITIVNTTDGWFNNQYQTETAYTYYNDAMAEIDKADSHISDVTEVFNNGDQYGCFVGTVPISCRTLSFDGVEAQLIAQTATIDGKNYSFYLYYLPAEYTENAEIEYIDENNQKIDIVIEHY